MKRSGALIRLLPGQSVPLWSPDGGRMVLMDGRRIWLANGDGTRRTRIGQGWTAAWSPNGKFLALALGRRLWLVNRDGSGLRRLPIEVPKCANCESNEASPSWSPDGRRLVFEHGEREPGSWGAASVWVADLDGQNLRRLAAPGESPRWSPDGTRISYLAYPYRSDPAPEVHVVGADGSNDRNLGRGESAVWSPRGATLAFEGVRFPKRVYVVPPTGRITTLGRSAAPSWAPDGKRIAFERRGSIFVAGANGKRQRRVARGVQPSWSPDGRLIAYAGAHCGANQGIHLIRPNGTGHRHLTDFCFRPRGDSVGVLAAESRVAFPGLNGRILFRSDRARRGIELWVTSPGGAERRRLRLGAHSARWSPNGRRIVFAWQGEIYVAKANGKGVRSLTRNRAYEANPTWSPNGKRILFSARGGFYLMSAAGSQRQRLKATSLCAGNPTWSTRSRKIAFAAYCPEQGAAIYVMDASGANLHKIGPGDNPDFSPDGTQLVVDSGNPQGSVQVMNIDGSNRRAIAVGADAAWSPDGKRIVFARQEVGFCSPYERVTRLLSVAVDGSGEVEVTPRTSTGQCEFKDSDPDWQPVHR